ncbi:MAG: hypothetical protein QXT97_02435 [Candidatus Diapherotrites archaeon]
MNLDEWESKKTEKALELFRKQNEQKFKWPFEKSLALHGEEVNKDVWDEWQACLKQAEKHQ